MGYMSTIVILNDAMGAIDRDPAGWWRHTQSALYDAMGSDIKSYSFAGNAGCFYAVSNEHADVSTLIVVGGNTVVRLAQRHTGHTGPTDADAQLVLLRDAADKLGYRLIRKPKKG